MPADVLPYIESTWLINMTNLTYSSQCNSWRPGRSDDKGLSSLPASLYKRKFEEFSMNGGPGFNKKNSSHLCDEFPYSAIQLPAAIFLWESSGFLVLRSENIQLPEDESSGSCILPGRSRQVLSAPFGKSETSSACLLLHCW